MATKPEIPAERCPTLFPPECFTRAADSYQNFTALSKVIDYARERRILYFLYSPSIQQILEWLIRHLEITDLINQLADSEIDYLMDYMAGTPNPANTMQVLALHLWFRKHDRPNPCASL